MAGPSTPQTLGQLRRSATGAATASRTVKDEIRANLIRKLQAHEPLFPGIIGYDETVVPQLVNAVLSRHNFILLGLRGQAKSRILRALVDLLDDADSGHRRLRDPRQPVRADLRRLPEPARGRQGDDLPIAWLPREAPLRGEAGDAGRHDRGHDRRHRSDQGGARRDCSSPTS